ncbi:hypothetical protein [Nostoc sp.]
MVAIPNSSYISPEDYLKGEETSPIKHEYRRGQVYAREHPLLEDLSFMGKYKGK